MEECSEERYGAEMCAHCEGDGCTYCDRRGSVMVLQPAKRCTHCEGDGCIYCGFTGWAHVRVEKLSKGRGFCNR